VAKQSQHVLRHYNGGFFLRRLDLMLAPDLRLEMLSRWVMDDLGHPDARLSVASADASFRRYFRAQLLDSSSLIVMDAPPDHENLGPYLQVTQLLTEIGVHVPQIHAVDRLRGFLLIEDLGVTQYLEQLPLPGRASKLYDSALASIYQIQTRGLMVKSELLSYDAVVLQRELSLMPEWFCARHLGVHFTAEESQLWEASCQFLIAECLAQPIVFVHRDYHSRNLMVLTAGGPGVIDFQDAVAGPVGYDLVSLLKDCYIAWPRLQVEQWLSQYRSQLQRTGFTQLCGNSELEFLRWFDFSGLQRHLKVLGIFARLWWRDGKISYLKDLQRTLDYVLDTAARYPELRDFQSFCKRRMLPSLGAANVMARTSVIAAEDQSVPR